MKMLQSLPAAKKDFLAVSVTGIVEAAFTAFGMLSGK
jgi:hypothetical protein